MKIIKKAVSPDEGDAAFFLFWVGGGTLIIFFAKMMLDVCFSFFALSANLLSRWFFRNYRALYR